MADVRLFTRNLIESLDDGFVITDPVGVIPDVNHTMESLAGHADEALRMAMSEGTLDAYELTARRRDGRETAVSYEASAFYGEGEGDGDGGCHAEGLFGVVRDMTDQKCLENLLREKNIELREANIATNEFVRRMGHSLRTPLTAILGFTGVVLMGLPGPLNDEQRRQLELVQTAGRDLLSMINEAEGAGPEAARISASRSG